MSHNAHSHMRHDHVGHDHIGHGHAGHDHAAMVTDFRRRFWVSVILTIPVLALSPLIRDLLALNASLTFRGDSYVLFAFSVLIYFYCGWPFLKGVYDEIS